MKKVLKVEELCRLTQNGMKCVCVQIKEQTCRGKLFGLNGSNAFQTADKSFTIRSDTSPAGGYDVQFYARGSSGSSDELPVVITETCWINLQKAIKEYNETAGEVPAYYSSKAYQSFTASDFGSYRDQVERLVIALLRDITEKN